MKNPYNREATRAHARLDATRFRHGELSAMRKGRVWAFTFSQWKALVIGQSCHYCSGKLSDTGYALDRKDPKVGYTVDNCVPCCGECNFLKSDKLTYEEMLAVTILLKAMRSPC